MTDEELIKKYIARDKQNDSLNKLHNGYPVQYLIGNVEFNGYKILVNESVLIPRFETEYLIERTIKYLNKLNISNPKVLDIGTGSGCISIALKKLISCNIDALDISKGAINIAKKNAKLNDVEINFIQLDVHKFNSNKKYDLIISNPPYVKYNKDIEERLKYEPKNAIFASNNGLYYYETILDKIKNNLNDNFLIAFEIDDGEGTYIKDLAYKYLSNVNVYIEKDYNDLERYVFLMKEEN